MRRAFTLRLDRGTFSVFQKCLPANYHPDVARQREHGWQEYSLVFTFYRYNATGVLLGSQKVTAALELGVSGDNFASRSSIETLDTNDDVAWAARPALEHDSGKDVKTSSQRITAPELPVCTTIQVRGRQLRQNHRASWRCSSCCRCSRASRAFGERAQLTVGPSTTSRRRGGHKRGSSPPAPGCRAPCGATSGAAGGESGTITCRPHCHNWYHRRRYSCPVLPRAARRTRTQLLSRLRQRWQNPSPVHPPCSGSGPSAICDPPWLSRRSWVHPDNDLVGSRVVSVTCEKPPSTPRAAPHTAVNVRPLQLRGRPGATP